MILIRKGSFFFLFVIIENFVVGEIFVVKDGDEFKEENTTWDFAFEESQRKELESKDVSVRDFIDYFHRVCLLPCLS